MKHRDIWTKIQIFKDFSERKGQLLFLKLVTIGKQLAIKALYYPQPSKMKRMSHSSVERVLRTLVNAQVCFGLVYRFVQTTVPRSNLLKR